MSDVTSSCSAHWLCRSGFPALVKILDRAIANMADMPRGSDIDINNVTLRLALDTTGACASLSDLYQAKAHSVKPSSCQGRCLS